jgi:hypothetical protein
MISKTKIPCFFSYVEDRYKRQICPHKQTWSYTSSYVEQASNSGTTLLNSGKEGKEERMIEDQYYHKHNIGEGREYTDMY